MNLLIIGASGNGKVCANIAQQIGHTVVGFIDDGKPMGTPFWHSNVLGNVAEMAQIVEKYNIDGFFVGIGDNFTRKKLLETIQTQFPQLRLPSLIHPSAWVSNAQIAEGTQICAGVILQPDVVVGKGCILNTGSQLDHDSSISDFASLAPGVVTGGGVSIGTESFIGISATIIHGKKIGHQTVVGAGSLVLTDIPNNVVAFGNPAKIIRQRTGNESYF